MKSSVMRGLGTAAAVSVGVVAAAGPAGATVTGKATTSKFEDTYIGRCTDAERPDITFRIKADLEGDGSGNWRYNVNNVKVTAMDNQGEGPWLDPFAKVLKMSISYRDDDDRVLWSMTKAKSTVQHGGRYLFPGNVDGVAEIKTTVWWYKFRTYDAESLSCRFAM